MEFTPEQIYAIDIAQRVSAALSFVGVFFIIGTFAFSHEYRKPANRIIFHAAWGNLMSSITSTMATAAPARGDNSALCQCQAVFMQWQVIFFAL
jgi:hypothetical protein